MFLTILRNAAGKERGNKGAVKSDRRIEDDQFWSNLIDERETRLTFSEKISRVPVSGVSVSPCLSIPKSPLLQKLRGRHRDRTVPEFKSSGASTGALPLPTLLPCSPAPLLPLSPSPPLPLSPCSLFPVPCSLFPIPRSLPPNSNRSTNCDRISLRNRII